MISNDQYYFKNSPIKYYKKEKTRTCKGSINITIFNQVEKFTISYFRVSKSYFLRYTYLLCIYTARTWMCAFQMPFFIIYPKFGLIFIICFEIFNVLQSPSCYYRHRSILGA